MYVCMYVLVISSNSINYSQGNPNIGTNEIIVRLNYKYLIHEIIEDTTQQVLHFNGVLNPSGVSILNQIGIPGLGGQLIRKAFPLMSWRDTIAKNIYGEKIAVPPFWATFIFTVPNENKLCPTLKKLLEKPELIEYAHPNYSAQSLSIPNDSLYYRQESLNGNPTLPNAGINVEEAWDIETGEKFVKVAVLDTGIDTLVEDLKILFGGPYYNPYTFPIAFNTGYGVDNEGHGTQVAAIIGAKRNNGVGTAGIAGGNNANEEGVSLIDLKTTFLAQNNSFYLCAATVDAARTVGSLWQYPVEYYQGEENNYFQSTPGFGVNIQNNSYTILTDLPKCDQEKPNPRPSEGGNTITDPSCVLCREAFLFSYKTGIINVVARGNSGLLSDGQDETYVEGLYPQNFPDSWIISVGASAYDGTTIRNGVNQGVIDAQSGYYSLYSGKMDLIAPGSDSIVYGPLSSNFDEPFRFFNGTSAAAPHVSGVVALLLSHYNKPCYSNKNLAIEDVEYILETSATDVLDSGFDEVSGAGRLNAGAALKMIENPTKQIVHPQTLLSSEEVSRDTISLGYGQAFVGNNWGPISNGFPLTRDREYKTVKVLYENTYSFAEYGTSSAQIEAYWPRISASNSVKFYEDYDSIYNGPAQGYEYTFDKFDMTPDVVNTTIDEINKTIKTQGYYYHFIGEYFPSTININPNIPIDSWLPINPENDTAKMPVSLYIIDTLQTSWYDYECDSANLPWDSTWVPFNGTNELELKGLKLYPNPSKEYIQIEFNNIVGLKNLQLSDLNGKIVKIFETKESNYHLNIADLNKGIYLLTCSLEKAVYHYKIVKE
jgi:subtilisin family serine protease